MKKKNLLLGLALGLSLLLTTPQNIIATSCEQRDIDGISISPSEFITGTVNKITIQFDQKDLANDEYKVVIYKEIDDGDLGTTDIVIETEWMNENEMGNHVFTKETALTFNPTLPTASTHAKFTVYLRNKDGLDNTNWCTLGEYSAYLDEIPTSSTDYPSHCSFTISQQRNEETCYYGGTSNCLEINEPITIKTSGIVDLNTGKPLILDIDEYGSSNNLTYVLSEDGAGVAADIPIVNSNGPGTAIGKFTAHEKNKYSLVLKPYSFSDQQYCSFGNFNVSDRCDDECDGTPITIGGVDNEDDPFDLCKQIPESAPAYQKCLACFENDVDGDGQGDGMWTAIGCIDTSSTEGIVGKLMKTGMSIAGGIALLMILASAFLFATSEGEPKRTSEAKEILTSAIIGLIFIIFSVTILQFIGVNILHIPGFGE